MNADPQTTAAALIDSLRPGQLRWVDQMCAACGQNRDDYLLALWDGTVAQQIAEFIKHRPEPPKPLCATEECAPRGEALGAGAYLTVSRYGPKPKFSQREIITMREMRAAGEKTKSIAMRFRVSPMTIRRYLHRARTTD